VLEALSAIKLRKEIRRTVSIILSKGLKLFLRVEIISPMNIPFNDSLYKIFYIFCIKIDA